MGVISGPLFGRPVLSDGGVTSATLVALSLFVALEFLENFGVERGSADCTGARL